MIRRFNPETRDNTEMKEKAATARAMNILEAFEYIVELAKDSALNDEFMKKAGRHIRYASRRLGLSQVQTVMLALFVDRSEDNSIMLSELADFLGCRTTRILRLSSEVDVLEKHRYVRARRGGDRVSYRVPGEVLLSLKEGKPYVYEQEKISTLFDFFDIFKHLFSEHEKGEIDHDTLTTSSREYLETIPDSHFVREMRRRFCDTLNDDEMWLFIYMAHLFVFNNDDMIRFGDIENFYDNNKIPSYIRSCLRDRHSLLFRQNLIENTSEEGMANSNEFKLTDFAKQEVLAELNLKMAGKSDNDLIKHDTLAEKKLVYNETEKSQIEELSSILSAERFAEVQKRLENAGMRKGFCCLFYGAPGTGKTETVYQLARITGRDIMRVDVDKVKSCWVGESEKNIKKIFDTYRAKCRASEKAPILLFNEADAVLGIRMEGAQSAVNKMENSIQNIILQEMESLEGIMIATTNLTSNLDKAFERRFLYKIRYEKPTEEARAKIWQGMMAGLGRLEAETLAREFDLSGGEIENIVRKHTVSAIISGNEVIDLEAIMESCRHERISQASRKRIGF